MPKSPELANTKCYQHDAYQNRVHISRECLTLNQAPKRIALSDAFVNVALDELCAVKHYFCESTGQQGLPSQRPCMCIRQMQGSVHILELLCIIVNEN
eukprot:XP_001710237.1 Hypothetical protein GL50803_102740 [Giardia lamblia ATCC 50803]